MFMVAVWTGCTYLHSFFQDKEKNAAKIIQEQLQYANNIPIYDYREPWVAANKNIPNRKEFLKMNSGV